MENDFSCLHGVCNKSSTLCILKCKNSTEMNRRVLHAGLSFFFKLCVSLTTAGSKAPHSHLFAPPSQWDEDKNWKNISRKA